MEYTWVCLAVLLRWEVCGATALKSKLVLFASLCVLKIERKLFRPHTDSLPLWTLLWYTTWIFKTFTVRNQFVGTTMIRIPRHRGYGQIDHVGLVNVTISKCTSFLSYTCNFSTPAMWWIWKLSTVAAECRHVWIFSNLPVQAEVLEMGSSACMSLFIHLSVGVWEYTLGVVTHPGRMNLLWRMRKKSSQYDSFSMEKV